MLKLNAYAKINLTLDVLCKRTDGYHEVSMVMQSIDLADQVTLRAQDGNITVEVNIPALACDHTNLAYKAAALLQEKFQINKGVHITLEKNIPMAAGLAGGSANAAAVLQGLNLLWELGLSQQQLEELGAMLGSDIPFCLRGGTVLASGRGEVLTPLAPVPECYVVLAKPDICVSTATTYKEYCQENVCAHPNNDHVIDALRRQDMPAIIDGLCNVLESVTIKRHPIIADIKQHMLDFGAMNSLMSGSGPTVFGLAPDEQSAQAIYDKLKQHYGDTLTLVVAKTLAKME